MRSLRILVVFTEPPLPFGGAAARWFYVMLKGLVERGHQVTAFAPCGSVEQMATTANLFPAPRYDLRLYPHPARKGLRAKLATIRRPYSYVFGPNLRNDLDEECGPGFDVLHLETTWSGWLGQGRDPSRTVLNLHSLYEIDLAAQKLTGWTDRFHQHNRRKAERRLLRSYPTLLALTPRLKEAIQAIAPRATIHVVPLGLDPSLYPFTPSLERPSRPMVSLIGSMDWYPSWSAAVRLLTRLWPMIKLRVPQARLQIAGRNAHRALRDYIGQPDVEIAENVANIEPYFRRASLLLYAPARGTGMKVKVLEAFAYGVPVVTTSEGIEGLPARDGIHAGVCEDDQGLIQRTLTLLGNRSLQDRYRYAARELVETVCHPRVTLDGLEDCYRDLLARRVKACA
jgi:glycosyltransferase involved in cell wall biosynthesis